MTLNEDGPGRDFGSARIERAWEPPEEVVIPRALAESPLLDYDDLGVLIRLLLRDPDQPTNVPDLVKEFKAGGWTMGEKPLRRIMRRLKDAGHVSHEREYNPITQRPEWVFRVFRNPANNPQYTNEGVTALSQVRPIGPNRPDRKRPPHTPRSRAPPPPTPSPAPRGRFRHSGRRGPASAVRRPSRPSASCRG